VLTLRFPVLKGLPVRLAPRETLGTPGHRGLKVIPETLDRKAFKGFKVSKASRVIQANKAPKESRESKVFRVFKGNRG
jgi:hypothetical protein